MALGICCGIETSDKRNRRRRLNHILWQNLPQLRLFSGIDGAMGSNAAVLLVTDVDALPATAVVWTMQEFPEQTASGKGLSILTQASHLGEAFVCSPRVDSVYECFDCCLSFILSICGGMSFSLACPFECPTLRDRDVLRVISMASSGKNLLCFCDRHGIFCG